MPRRNTSVCFQFRERGKCSFGNKCKFPHVVEIKTPASQSSHASAFGDTEESSLEAFFALYPGFHYDTSASPNTEFGRLCRFNRWGRNNEEERTKAYNAFRDALTQQFNAIYGTDVNDIHSWHLLCSVLGIAPPEGLEACRQAVRSTHVNLIDLVVEPEEGVVLFDSEKALSEYTIKTGKFFPRDNAYAGGVLRFLLRHIMNPSDSSKTKSTRRKAK
ncbi:hypothetical protein BV25DRAFT_1822857 [Artomyces pyxidatus]|uniref:Uncharacterized protein n=1 Tax=Artomyces pyxidatus TaxID=48021 RepID=A0ACB8T7U2_9AGAM|nr:hypothetical protein BV25DRAFT_1822857 [Artomyces pyxidatus]